MREIKFRAWCDVNGMTDCFCIHSSGLFAYSNTDWVMDEEKPILMQYTGLKDKNGKEIYEGDVLIHHYYHENGVVIWHTGQSRWALEYFEDKKTQELFPIDKNNFEVIGNIYENPELMKGASK